LAGLFLCLLGWRQGYISIQTFSLIPVLFGLTGYLYGAGLMKLLSFPIAYLILMVPPPMNVLDSITLPMRYGISVATEFLLKTAGYGINRDGLLLSIGGHEIYMGAPCSGFRSLITMISLGLAYIYIGKSAVKKKIVLLASIVPLALLGNLIRVVGMCLVSFYLGETAGVKYHDYSGFIIFIVLIFGLIGLENFLEKAWK
jgi:exosortase